MRLPQWIVLLLIMVSAAALRVHDVGQSLWLDELHTGWVVIDGFSHLAERAAMGNYGPLYFYLTWMSVQALGANELALRLPSLLASVALIPAIYLAVRSWCRSTEAALLAATLVAVDPFLHRVRARGKGLCCAATGCTSTRDAVLAAGIDSFPGETCCLGNFRSDLVSFALFDGSDGLRRTGFPCLVDPGEISWNHTPVAASSGGCDLSCDPDFSGMAESGRDCCSPGELGIVCPSTERLVGVHNLSLSCLCAAAGHADPALSPGKVPPVFSLACRRVSASPGMVRDLLACHPA